MSQPTAATSKPTKPTKAPAKAPKAKKPAETKEPKAAKGNFPSNNFGKRATDKPTEPNKPEPNKPEVAPETIPAPQPPSVVNEEQPVPASNNEAFAKAVAELAKAYNMPAPNINNMPQPAITTPANKGRRAHEQSNGVSRPNAHTLCGKIWATADEITANNPNHSPAQISQLRSHPTTKDVNDHTIKTQYARWRQFHGVHGRQVVVQAPQAPAKPIEEQPMPQAAETSIQQHAAAYGRRATDEPKVIGPMRRASDQ